MIRSYEAVVVGGGLNSLVATATLAKAGIRVLLVEARSELGGLSGSYLLGDGFRVNTCFEDASLLAPKVVKELGLRKRGLEVIESASGVTSLLDDGETLTLWREAGRTRDELSRRSPTDADRFPEFVGQMGRMAAVVAAASTLVPPPVRASEGAKALPFLKLVAKLRGLGRREMAELLRVVPLSAEELLEPWFEDEALQGLLSPAAVTGGLLGAYGAGGAYMMLYHRLGSACGAEQVRGGMGALIAAVARAARDGGAELRTGAAVAAIQVRNGRATSIRLENGEEIGAGVVVSGLDPNRTLLGLVGPQLLEPRFVRRVRGIRMQGASARIDLALSELPTIAGLAADDERLTGRIVVSPSLVHVERAYDDAKYRRFSARPQLEVTIPSILDPSLAPAGQHVMSVTVRYTPYDLDRGDWDTAKARLRRTVLDQLEEHAPGIQSLVLHESVRTPLDWERDFGLTRGDIYHGQMGLEQLAFMRPVPGWAEYRTPIDDLYLCGAGCHPGGGATGSPGRNAARIVLQDLRKR